MTESPRPSRGFISARPCLVALLLVAAGASCDRPRRHDEIGRKDGRRPGVGEIEPGEANLTAVAGQTIYVPAYSSVPTADNSLLYQLSITLSLRNTDRSRPIVINAVRYFDQDGRLVRDFLKKPLRIAPMAAMEYFIREGDSTGGTSSSFLVDWVADQAVSDPCVEAVMVGTAGNQGISFTCPGRVVATVGRPSREASSALPSPALP
jgi:hypothetical protein